MQRDIYDLPNNDEQEGAVWAGFQFDASSFYQKQFDAPVVQVQRNVEKKQEINLQISQKKTTRIEVNIFVPKTLTKFSASMSILNVLEEAPDTFERISFIVR